MLKQIIEKTYIVAHRECVDPLEQALAAEGFSTEVIRPDYSSAELEYSGAVRCMLNHMNVWKKIAVGDGLGLVVEADFVPVKGIGALPLPFPESKQHCALGYLYAGGATVFDVWVEQSKIYGRGHSSCTVAYIVGPEAARCLLQFAAKELQTQDLSKHNLWDCRIRMFLQERGITSWMPYRQYGEHGGIPNPEHARAGFNPSHQSDLLYESLYFLPLYAEGHRYKYAGYRLKATLRGVARLLTGRYLTWIDIRRAIENHTLGALLRFAAGRYLGLNFATYNRSKSRGC